MSSTSSIRLLETSVRTKCLLPKVFPKDFLKGLRDSFHRDGEVVL